MSCRVADFSVLLTPFLQPKLQILQF